MRFPATSSAETAPFATVLRQRSRELAAGWLSWCDRHRVAVATAVITVISVGFSAAWIAMDHVAPSFDQSHYLDLTTQYVRTARHDGLLSAARAVYDVDPSHAPLYPVAMAPFLALFGYSIRSGLLLNLMVWPLLLGSTALVSLRLFDRRTAVLSVVLVATTPIIVGLAHEALVDFLLIGFTTLTVALLLWSDSMSHRRLAIAVGVSFGLGWLIKVDFPAFVIGPLLIVGIETAIAVVRELRDPAARSRGIARAVNTALAAALALGIAAAWYVPSLGPTRDYIQSTTSGLLTIGAAPDNPRTLHAFLLFTQGMLDKNLFWVIPMAILVAGVPVLAWWVVRLPRASAARVLGDLRRAAVLLTWFAIPYVSVALGHNQDYRLMAPAFIAVAIIAAGLITSVPLRWMRRLLVGGSVVLATFQVVSIQTPQPQLRILPAQYDVYTGLGWVSYPFDGASYSYDRRTIGDDVMAPVMHSLESWEPGRRRMVCALQDDQLLNTNTLSFLADADGAQGLVWSDLKLQAGDAPSLVGTLLMPCDAILYMPAVAPDAGPLIDRGKAVNATALNRFITEADLAHFPRRLGSFPVEPGREVAIFALPPTPGVSG